MPNDHAVVPRDGADDALSSRNLASRGLADLRELRSGSQIRVLHLDDVVETRQALKRLVDGVEDIVVIFDTGSSQEALQAYSRLRPDVFLQDVRRPLIDGFATLELLRQRDPAARVLFLTVGGGISVIRSAINLGARGFIHKPPVAEELLDGIRSTLDEQRSDTFFFDGTVWRLHGQFTRGTKLEQLNGSHPMGNAALIMISRRGDSPHPIRWTDDLCKQDIWSLDLGDSQLKDIDVSLIREMSSLEYLTVPDGVLDTLEIQFLRSMPGLRDLHVVDAKVQLKSLPW